MMRLDDREWKSFTVEELFTRIVSTKGKTTGQLIPGGDVPYIAAAKNNNGCAGVYSCKEYPEWVSEGNCIVFVQLGDGAAGIAHYIPMDFIGMSGKTSCGYIDGSLDRYNGVFIAKALSANKAIFSHGHSWTGRRLLKSRCILPATSDGKPDYEFMTAYMRDMDGLKRKQYRGYIEKRIAELGAIPDDQKVDWKSLIDSHEWEPFYMSQIFDEPQRGKRIVNENHIEGNTPLVSSQGTNNGVTNFVGNEDGVRRFKNCLSIANGGSSAGKCYYQPFEFVGADHVTQCFRLNASPQQYLFLSTIVSKALMGKYGFSHEIKDKALVRERVLLPVTDDGQPDYDFMEEFGKKVMSNKYKQYLECLQRQ